MKGREFETELRRSAERVNGVLAELLGGCEISGRLREVLEYTVGSPGKRIRSVVVLWCCELISGQVNRDAEVSAAAVEMVHSYSLVHDDLPAMDDDDIRRGRPSCHKAFGEGVAILAGDALLSVAFEVLAKEISEPAVAVRLIRQLAEDAGPGGMIAGQIADLQAQGTEGSRELVEYIHTNKTAKLFRCSAVMGGICGGAGEDELGRLGQYGLKLGLGFQMVDDILDVSGSSEQLGKTAGKDAKAGKCTYPGVVGLEQARQAAERLADEAAATAGAFGEAGWKLARLAGFLLERTR